MNEHDEVVINNVTPEQIEQLTTLFKAQGGAVSGAESGLVENACFAAKFHYDKSVNLLTLEPLRLVQSLTPRRIRKMVQQLTAPPKPLRMEAGQTIYEPSPYACATYNWAIGFFTNNSGGILTYSGSSTDHGNLNTVISKINPGDTPATHQDGFWVNQAPKDSVQGCGGSISYQLADGVTTLTVYYYINTSVTYSASAALSGQNAARYTATCDYYHQYTKATDYLYPYVTIAKAS